MSTLVNAGEGPIPDARRKGEGNIYMVRLLSSNQISKRILSKIESVILLRHVPA